MGYAGGSFLGYLHTRRITQKSMSCFPFVHTTCTEVTRTLVATIKDFGTCPCPRCFVTIDQISTLGQDDDRRRREESLRLDDVNRRKSVHDARRSLYQEGYAISGDHVDGLLKEESRVPTEVFVSFYHTRKSQHYLCRMHFP